MKCNLILSIMIVFLSMHTAAQPDAYLIRQRGSFSVLPAYQWWSLDDSIKFSQASTPVSFYLPLSRALNVSIRGTPSRITGDLIALSGLTDTQIGLTYHWEGPELVFTLGLNVPTGKRELTPKEFQTSILSSNNIFDLQASNYGQGFNINPGVMWAIPFGESVVFGIAGSYQYRGKFKPIKDFDDYDPGDEYIAVGGIDIRLGETARISGDLLYTFFASDRLGSTDIFASGGKLVTTIQYEDAFGTNELSVFGRYRMKGKSEILRGGILTPESDKIEPDQYDLRVTYSLIINRQILLGFTTQAKYYEKTAASLSGITMFGVGIVPRISVNSSLDLISRIKFQYGKFNDNRQLLGLEGGAGIVLSF
ncbi:MAG: hypothetical protein HY707_09925 [Ignavibacteriae bacterium]|nr:hypothetical protein [Ignavibacteriota bacterium]